MGLKAEKCTVFPLLLSPPEDPQDKNGHFYFDSSFLGL